jgi:hypothetical protein
MHLVGADVFQPEPIRRVAEISTELRNLRVSDAQGYRREAGSEGSAEQMRKLMDKNRI